MKSKIQFIYMGIWATTLFSCKKESCIKCETIGKWEIKETSASFVDGNMTSKQISNFTADFFENGNGVYLYFNSINEDGLYWSIDPNGEHVFVSLNILGDTLRRTEQFDIIYSGVETHLWRNEQITKHSVLKLEWELSKI